MEEVSTPLRLKIRSFKTTCNRHVEVRSTHLRLKITSPFIRYACDQQVEEISTPLRLKIRSFKKNLIYLINQVTKGPTFL